eukprot:9960189-Alexandrium_andersonii.AAC.1
MALAHNISGVTRVENGGVASETEPDGEESPGSSDSEMPDRQREHIEHRDSKKELQDGEWVKVGDEWAVHHRDWRN